MLFSVSSCGDQGVGWPLLNKPNTPGCSMLLAAASNNPFHGCPPCKQVHGFVEIFTPSQTAIASETRSCCQPHSRGLFWRSRDAVSKSANLAIIGKQPMKPKSLSDRDEKHFVTFSNPYLSPVENSNHLCVLSFGRQLSRQIHRGFSCL